MFKDLKFRIQGLKLEGFDLGFSVEVKGSS